MSLSLSLFIHLFLLNLNIISPSFSPIFLSIPSSVNLSNMQNNMKFLSANLPVSLSLFPSIVWCLFFLLHFLPTLLLLLLCLLGGQEGQTLQKLAFLTSNALPTPFFTTQSFNNYFSHIYLVLLLLTLSNQLSRTLHTGFWSSGEHNCIKGQPLKKDDIL